MPMCRLNILVIKAKLLCKQNVIMLTKHTRLLTVSCKQTMLLAALLITMNYNYTRDHVTVDHVQTDNPSQADLPKSVYLPAHVRGGDGVSLSVAESIFALPLQLLEVLLSGVEILRMVGGGEGGEGGRGGGE